MAKWGKNGANCFQSSETFDTISLSCSFIFFVMCKYISFVILLSPCPTRLVMVSRGTPASANYKKELDEFLERIVG